MKSDHLKIDPAIRDDGRVDYILRDTETKENVFRGDWKDVKSKKDEIIKREKEEA